MLVGSIPARVLLGFIFLTFASSLAAEAGENSRALRIYSRLTSSVPDQKTLAKMQALVGAGKLLDAAALATSEDAFLNVTLVRFANPMSNINETSEVQFNDFTATVVGITRDNIPFDQALYEDIIYTGPSEVNGVAIIPYGEDPFMHYRHLIEQNLNFRTGLIRKKQSEVQTPLYQLPAEATSGLLTTSMWAKEFLRQGTNRRPNRFAFKSFLCMDYEQMSDTSRSDYRVGLDVTRAPGGNRNAYLSSCKGCHAGGDALRGAWAYYDYTNRLVYTSDKVQPKYLSNRNVTPSGFVTIDDSWENLWIDGVNSRLGWKSGSENGHGVKELGRAFSRTAAFPQCMAKRVFEQVCLRKLNPKDKEVLVKLSAGFTGSNFNLRKLFESVATEPRCITP